MYPGHPTRHDRFPYRRYTGGWDETGTYMHMQYVRAHVAYSAKSPGECLKP